MDKAVAGTEGKHLSGESGQPGMSRCLETRAERRVGGKDGWSQRGSEKPARTWRPGIKGKAKRLNSSLEERTAEASLDRLCPKGPVKHPLTPSDKRVSSHARAEGADLKPQLPAGGPEVPTQAEPEVKTLQAPPGLLSKEETLHFQREGVRVTDVFETCKVSGWSDHPQVGLLFHSLSAQMYLCVCACVYFLSLHIHNCCATVYIKIILSVPPGDL